MMKGKAELKNLFLTCERVRGLMSRISNKAWAG